MNPVLLASASTEMTANAAQEIAPGQGMTSSGTTQTFSLSQQTAVMRGAKAAHQQMTAEAKKNDDTDPAAMQALLAMLLNQQQAQTPVQTGVTPNNGMLQKLAAAAAGNTGGQSPILRQLAESLARANATDSDVAGSGKNGSSSDLSQLSPKLQGLLASLAQKDAPQTAQQQASLAKLSAEDLRAIAPAQPSVAERVEARTKPTDPGTTRSGIARKSQGAIAASGPTSAMTASTTAMHLSNVTLNNLPAAQTNGQELKLAHSTLPVDPQADEWGDKLTALLKDRIQFQLNQQQQVSTIRLDPPSLGKLEIAIQLDSGKLMVHIGANQTDVMHSLQQFSDDLRQHLTQQNFMEVNVQVSSEGQSQQQQQPGHQQDEVMSALALNDEPQYQHNESVLIKV